MEIRKIENWLDKTDFAVHSPSDELLDRIKGIPNQFRDKGNKDIQIVHWITWLAAACFIGFMIINVSIFTKSNNDKTILEAYLPNATIYGI